MENLIFIHGSSVGQSAFVPSNVPKDIANKIANKYFNGREQRKMSAQYNKGMVIESFEGYTCFTFLINDCLGSDGRAGQYFAITILSKDKYFYLEELYSLLEQVYNKLFVEQGKFLSSQNKYLIVQFSDKSDIAQKILSTTDINVSKLQYKNINLSKISLNHSNGWEGIKIDMSIANSNKVYDNFIAGERIYLSDEYPSEQIKHKKELDILLEKNSVLQAEFDNYKKQAERISNNKIQELENINLKLEKEIRNRDAEIKTLRQEKDKQDDKLVKGMSDIFAPYISVLKKKIGGIIPDEELKKDNKNIYILLIGAVILIFIFVLFFFNNSSLNKLDKKIDSNFGNIENSINAKLDSIQNSINSKRIRTNISQLQELDSTFISSR
ncbi:MAG: hypothetical protein SPK94_06750 [Bacteroidales bacterium]|nr:hypothetical protein [Bacteroidales bacterium]